MTRRKIIWLIIFFFVAIILLFLLRISFGPVQKDDKTGKVISPLERTAADIPEYSQGLNLVLEGKHAESLPLLRTAVDQARGDEEKAYTKYLYALSLIVTTPADTSNLNKGLAIFKELINEPKYPAIIKAQAVQNIERLVSLSPYSQQTKATLFQGEPFARFATSDREKLQKSLLEYGTEFHHSSGMEWKLASLYAKNLIASSEEARLDPGNEAKKEKFQTEKNLIMEHARYADLDMKERLEKKSYLQGYIPEALLYKAQTAKDFQKATSTTPFGYPEDVFREAQAAVKKYPTYAVPIAEIIEYKYAVYLSEMLNKEERKTEVDNLLKRYYAPNVVTVYMKDMFRAERNNTIGEKNSLVTLSSDHPKFKAFLLDSGWVENDFVR